MPPLDRGSCRASELGRAIGKHPLLVHEQHVGAPPRRGEGLLPHHDEIDVADLVEIAVGEVLLVGIGRRAGHDEPGGILHELERGERGRREDGNDER